VRREKIALKHERKTTPFSRFTKGKPATDFMKVEPRLKASKLDKLKVILYYVFITLSLVLFQEFS